MPTLISNTCYYIRSSRYKCWCQTIKQLMWLYLRISCIFTQFFVLSSVSHPSCTLDCFKTLLVAFCPEQPSNLIALCYIVLAWWSPWCISKTLSQEIQCSLIFTSPSIVQCWQNRQIIFQLSFQGCLIYLWLCCSAVFVFKPG